MMFSLWERMTGRGAGGEARLTKSGYVTVNELASLRRELNTKLKTYYIAKAKVRPMSSDRPWAVTRGLRVVVCYHFFHHQC
jgi:molybdenum-dependent DNA-binding transcriptional regulator ModE